jgi:hypothetical protein
MSVKFMTLKLSDAIMPAMARVLSRIESMAHDRVMLRPGTGIIAFGDWVLLGPGRLLTFDHVDEKGWRPL